MLFETNHGDYNMEASDCEVHDLLCEDRASPTPSLSLSEALLPLVKSSGPQPTPPLYSTRYKTELCSRYAETGECKYAERCQFAHGLHDLHVPSRHPKYKTELCRSYHTAGYCLYGTRCLFVHNLQEQRASALPHRRPGYRRTVLCRNYRAHGVCPFGNHCHFLHSSGSEVSEDGSNTWTQTIASPASPPASHPIRSHWKPRGTLCRTFSAFGFCVYGIRCRFQHGLPQTLRGSEIQTSSPWPAPQPAPTQVPTRAVSPASDMRSVSPTWSSSTSSSPPSALTSPLFPSSDFTAPLTCDALANNAFTFSSQHLNDLLLPLALRLQHLENSQGRDLLDEPLSLG